MSNYVYVLEVYGTFNTYLCIISDFTPLFAIYLFSTFLEFPLC